MKRSHVALVLGVMFAYAFVRNAVIASKVRGAAASLRKLVPL